LPSASNKLPPNFATESFLLKATPPHRYRV
jgi:hypothetical protein